MSTEPKAFSQAQKIIAIVILLITAFAAMFFRGNAVDNREKIAEMYQGYKAAFPGVSDLSVEKLLTRQRKEKVILVDAREPAEQKVSMIPGAITGKEFMADLENYRNRAVVVYCTIGKRSGILTRKLRQQHIKAFNLKGGVLAWAQAGKKFVDNKGKETNRVHVYGSRWNLLPPDYQGVW